MLQFDGIAIYKSWSHPNIIGYEIKVSRSDFLRDAKYTGYIPYCNEFYFVTPAGLVQRQEVEENIGLMWYNQKNGSLTIKKKAIHREIEVNSSMLLYIIMNRLDSDRHPFHFSKAEYWKDWLNNKINNRELGYIVKSELLKKILVLENELKRLRFKREELDALKNELIEIDTVMVKHGIGKFVSRAKILDNVLDMGYPIEIDSLFLRLQDAIRSVDRIKNVYKNKEV